MNFRFLVLGLILFAPLVSAADFTEDFEGFVLLGFNPDTKPDQSWYNYREDSNIGNITGDESIEGSQAFSVQAATTSNPSFNTGYFALAVATTLDSTQFHIRGENGTRQIITLESSAPTRHIVQFYVFCSAYCELRVRWEPADTTGQVLIPATMNQTEFKIEVDFDWINSEFCLTVDDIDDGCFPTLELPKNFGRIRFSQERGDFPMNVLFDNWTVIGAFNGTEGIEGDAADGIRSFSIDIGMTGPASRILFGIVLFVICIMAVFLPSSRLGKSNSLLPAMGFFIVLLVLWLIMMEFWPEWVGTSFIIFASALIALVIRRVALGIRNTSSGAAMVAGSLGYFIITATFLGFAGYHGIEVELPTSDQDRDETDISGEPPENISEQSFGGAVVECIVSGGVFTFGLTGDCSQKTQTSKTYKWLKTTVQNIGEVVATIFSYAKAALAYLFQLLSFQMPIPTIFNMMIVLPPAAALATFAIQTIRGTGN